MGQDWVKREGRAQAPWHLYQKLLNTKCSMSRCAQITNHEMRNILTPQKKKKSLKPNAASHNNASWYTDTDGFLEHSPSRGSLYYNRPSLQKIFRVFWRSPLVLEFLIILFFVSIYKI